MIPGTKDLKYEKIHHIEYDTNIFDDKELTNPVGTIVSQYTIVPFKNKYYQNGLSTYYLPKGTITIINANKNFIKKSDSTYVLPLDKSFLNSIASRIGYYINRKGSLFRSKVIENINYTRKLVFSLDE